MRISKRYFSLLVCDVSSVEVLQEKKSDLSERTGERGGERERERERERRERGRERERGGGGERKRERKRDRQRERVRERDSYMVCWEGTSGGRGVQGRDNTQKKKQQMINIV